MLEHFQADREVVEVRRFGDMGFLLIFNTRTAADRVLHAMPPEQALFRLVFRCWTRQLHATSIPMLFKVLVALENLPAHVWSLEAAQTILGSSCSMIQLALETAEKTDMSKFWVTAWCLDPDLIPKEKTVVIPEPDELHDPCGHLFLKPHEVIHSRKETLHYQVLIHLVECHDFNPRSDSDDDFLGWPRPRDDGDDSDNSDDDYLGFNDAGGSSKPCPRKHRFSCANDRADSD